jgi:hypothetical protein
MVAKVDSQAKDDAERSILSIAPEREGLDWICYRVRGGVEPALDVKPPATSVALVPHGRPDRQDIVRALGQLVSQGLLTYDGRCWTMTAKGYAAL